MRAHPHTLGGIFVRLDEKRAECALEPLTQRALDGNFVRTDEKRAECALEPLTQRALDGNYVRTDEERAECALTRIHSAGFLSARTRNAPNARCHEPSCVQSTRFVVDAFFSA